MHNEEIKFLGGIFFDLALSKSEIYLFKYFRSPLEKQFVRYYLCFNNIDYFVAHTGWFCQRRWLIILEKRFNKIINFHRKCKQEFNLELLSKVEKGKYKFI